MQKKLSTITFCILYAVCSFVENTALIWLHIVWYTMTQFSLYMQVATTYQICFPNPKRMQRPVQDFKAPERGEVRRRGGCCCNGGWWEEVKARALHLTTWVKKPIPRKHNLLHGSTKSKKATDTDSDPRIYYRPTWVKQFDLEEGWVSNVLSPLVWRWTEKLPQAIFLNHFLLQIRYFGWWQQSDCSNKFGWWITTVTKNLRSALRETEKTPPLSQSVGRGPLVRLEGRLERSLLAGVSQVTDRYSAEQLPTKLSLEEFSSALLPPSTGEQFILMVMVFQKLTLINVGRPCFVW